MDYCSSVLSELLSSMLSFMAYTNSVHVVLRHHCSFVERRLSLDVRVFPNVPLHGTVLMAPWYAILSTLMNKQGVRRI